MRVSVVIPTYNEAQSIGRVLDDIPWAEVTEVLVVDSGSSDGTREIASSRGARVVLEPLRGYGRACLTGLAAATRPEVIAFLDGDYSDRPAELPTLLEPLRSGRADIVLGSRLAGHRMAGALPWHSVFGNRLAAGLIRLLCGLQLTDLGPFRAARYDVLRSLQLRELTYGWPVEMIVKGALRGLRIVEVPVSYHPRIGRSKITGTVRGTIGAGWCILSGIVKYRLRGGA
jgi:glycosyltransferase involved in cell wall biosynthesis